LGVSWAIFFTNTHPATLLQSSPEPTSTLTTRGRQSKREETQFLFCFQGPIWQISPSPVIYSFLFRVSGKFRTKTTDKAKSGKLWTQVLKFKALKPQIIVVIHLFLTFVNKLCH
jgi:hypothetical protein